MALGKVDLHTVGMVLPWDHVIPLTRVIPSGMKHKMVPAAYLRRAQVHLIAYSKNIQACM